MDTRVPNTENRVFTTAAGIEECPLLVQTQNREGKYRWSDKTSYRGQWADNKQDGLGTKRNKNGVRRLGKYENGQRVKWMEAVQDEAYNSDSSQENSKMNMKLTKKLGGSQVTPGKNE